MKYKRMKIAELNPGKMTNPEKLMDAVKYVKRGKVKPIEVKDGKVIDGNKRVEASKILNKRTIKVKK